MAIPKGITRKDVIQAMKDYQSARHNFRDSIRYDVLDGRGNAFPPNAIIGLAARRLNGGQPLKPKDVRGGEGSGASNSLLRSLGFRIVDKSFSVPNRVGPGIDQRIKDLAAEGEAELEKLGMKPLRSLPGQM
jgi:hypothetical protein